MFLKILSYDLFSKLSFDIKKKFPLIVLSTLLLSFLEMLSLSMIVPIITIVLKGSYEGIFSQFLIYLNLNKLLVQKLKLLNIENIIKKSGCHVTDHLKQMEIHSVNQFSLIKYI
jgi:hypothetical protein